MNDDRERTLANLREVAQHDSQATPDGSSRSLTARLARLGGIGLVLAVVLGKLKFVLPILKVLKVSSLVTMVVSIWAYSMLWGWSFAAGFVFLILIHEYGHLLVMRQLGIPAGAPTFIPFVGAVIAMKGYPRNAYVEAKVAFGGPILGSAAALVCLLIALAADSDFWRSLAFSGFMINLFNLLPISPLDGGRIVGAIHRGMWLIGFAIGIPAFLATRSPILFLILLFGLLGLFRRHQQQPGYYDVPTSTRYVLALAYFGLAALLAAGATFSHVEVAGMASAATTR